MAGGYIPKTMATPASPWPKRLLLACVLALLACTETVANPIRPAPGQAGTAGSAGADGGVPDQDDERPPFDGAVEGEFEDVPATRHCASVADWPEPWAEAELALFAQLNALRMQRPRCMRDPSHGELEVPLQPFRLAPELRCSTRLHSRDMTVRKFSNTVNPEGLDPADRAAAAGFSFFGVAERIAVGSDPGQVLEDLRDSRDYCAILANPAFGAVGLGLYQQRWTLDFAGP